MKVTELKIGNYILGLPLEFDENEDWEVCEVVILDSVGETEYEIWVDSKSNSEHFSEFKPIPLTEDWLIKFELEKMSESEYTLNTYDLANFKLWMNGGRFLFNDTIEIKYVHRLQNLYFDLKDKELKLK